MTQTNTSGHDRAQATAINLVAAAKEATSYALIKRLFEENGRAHLKSYIFAILLMSVGGAITAYSAYLTKPLLNGMMKYDAASFSTFRWLAYTVAILFLVRGIATFGQSLILARIGNEIVAKVQMRVFAHLLHQPVGFFQDRYSGEFITRVAMSANGIRDTLQVLITTVGRDFLTLAFLMTGMLIQDWMLTLIAFCVLPLGTVALRRLIKRVRDYTRRSYDGTTQIMEIIQETVRGIRIVKSFNLEAVQQQRMNDAVKSVYSAANRIAASVALTSPVGETLSGFSVAAVMLYGGWRVSVAHADPGSFVAFLVSLMFCYDPAKRLGRANVELQNGLTATRLIYEILDLPEAEGSEVGKPDLEVSSGLIRFDNVFFRYRAEEPVLQGATFIAEPHKTTALVGPSGGGKSTIINLLQRFYEPEQGKIFIDDQNIEDTNLVSLRERIAFVSQDVFLFRGTIEQNIAYGKPGASRAEIVDAARKANAHDFIMNFVQGYDTNVGEQGAQMSGGQRQRIAIARAILKDAAIILLDEPTAALDSESEREVQKALDDLRKERTTIVVAHRLQTIFNADKICVIEGGKLVESGTHEELLAHAGPYHSFFSAQFGGTGNTVRLTSKPRDGGSGTGR